MIDTLVQCDKDLFLFLNGMGTETWDAFWLFITNKLSSIPLYALLLFLSYRYLGMKRTLITLVFVGLLITATDQLANFFKYGVARLRPCHDVEINTVMRLVKSSCGGKFGYFSAHAANSMALATFFTVLLKQKLGKIGLLLFIWALLVGYSRVYIGVHFPLDVITGMVIGILFGWLFSKLSIFAFQKMGT
ncbi:MAG: phosphatase PAP2 family protein [Bacteroidota bacterium]